MKNKREIPEKTCVDCIHEYACAMWCDAPGADPCNVGKRQLWAWRGMEDAE